MYLYILPIHVHLYSVCMMIHEIRYTAIHLYRDIGTKFQKNDATPVQRIPLEATKNRAANPIAADTMIPLWVTMTWRVPHQQLGDIVVPNPWSLHHSRRHENSLTKPSSRPSHMEPLFILKTSWPLKIRGRGIFIIFSKHNMSSGILVVSCCFRSADLRWKPRISWARNSKNPVQLGTPFPSTCCDRHDAWLVVSGRTTASRGVVGKTQMHLHKAWVFLQWWKDVGHHFFSDKEIHGAPACQARALKCRC